MNAAISEAVAVLPVQDVDLRVSYWWLVGNEGTYFIGIIQGLNSLIPS